MNAKSFTSHIMEKIPEAPKSAVILGSGLGNFVGCLDNVISIPYTEIPEYPQSGVPGHAGEWVFGYINKKSILCASGRFHLYEGFNLDEVTLPISVIHSLDCQNVIITNAAGCLKKEWQIGNFMLISGYLDYTFLNGSDPSSVVLFDEEQINQNIKIVAAKLGISLQEGIYAGVLGPSFETPAEIQDIISLGGNAVGMSTLHEIIKGKELGLKVIGISCLTNYGAGLKDSVLSHEDVLETSSQFNEDFSRLLTEIVEFITLPP